MNGLELMLSLIRYVLACKQVNLQWVQFLPEEVREERLIRGYLEIQVVQGHRLQFVKGPLELNVRLGREQKA